MRGNILNKFYFSLFVVATSISMYFLITNPGPLIFSINGIFLFSLIYSIFLNRR